MFEANTLIFSSIATLPKATILRVFLISCMLAMVGDRSDQVSESNCWWK
jgi:hypothetical protein